jgi:hypothetical protein
MNGHHDGSETTEEQAVFAKLFAFDQQPDPSPQFVARLSESLMPSTGRMTLLSATTSVEEPLRNLQPRTEAARGGKRRRPLISFGSAAVLMVLVVLVGYVVTLWAVDNSNDDPASLAQAATLEATGTAAADGCYVEPRDMNEIVVLLNAALYGVTGNGVPISPEATTDTTVGVAPAVGQPANAETTERVWTVFQQYMACWGIGDNLRMFALFTDDGVVRTLAPNGMANFYRVAALARAPHPGLVSFQNWNLDRVEMLTDGRAVLYVKDAAGGVSGLPDNYVILREIDGHWLIEETHLAQG